MIGLQDTSLRCHLNIISLGENISKIQQPHEQLYQPETFHIKTWNSLEKSSESKKQQTTV